MTLETGDALDADLGHCTGNFRGAVWKAPEHPAEGSVLSGTASGKPAGGGTPVPDFDARPHPVNAVSTLARTKACFMSDTYA
jgi:hypothetical protein